MRGAGADAAALSSERSCFSGFERDGFSGFERCGLRLRLANGSLDGSHIPNIQAKFEGRTQVFPLVGRRAVCRVGHAVSSVISARAAPLR